VWFVKISYGARVVIKHLSLGTLLLCSSGFVLADEAVSENAPEKLQVEVADAPAAQLDSMQIRAKAADLPATPANVPSTTESVTAKKIAESVNSMSSAAALLYLPSVHVRERYIGDVNGGLAIRGYGVNSSAQTIVYADGLLLSSHLNNSCCPGPRWGMVPQHSLDRVDVMYGPFSALYPGNSIGGVVLMTTHMPEKFETHAQLDAFGENFELYGTDKNFIGGHLAATIGNKINDFSFWLSADHLDNHSHPTDFTPASLRPSGVSATNPASTATNTSVVTGAYFDKGIDGKPRVTTASISADHTVKDDVTIKLGYDFTPTLHGTYTFDIWQNDSDKKSDTYLRDVVTGNKVYGTSTGAATDKYRFVSINGNVYNVTAPYVSHGESINHMHGLSLKSDTGGTWDWALNASYFNQNKDVVRQSSGNFGTTPGDAATKGTVTFGDGTGWKNLDLRGDWRPSGNLRSEHQVSFGYHYDNYETKTDKYNVVTGQSWRTGALGALDSNSRGETETQALYLQDAWQLNEDLKLVAGGRWEEWNAFNGSNYAQFKGVGTNVTYEDRTVHAFSPKVSISYQATSDWSLRSSYGKGVRFPTVGELFSNSGIKTTGGGNPNIAQITAFPAPYNTAKTNNPNLKPETANSWEFVAERYLTNGLWRTSIFGEEKQDALISQSLYDVLPGFVVSSVQNIDKVRTYGIETALQTSDALINGLDLSGSVAYIHTRIVKDDVNTGLEGTQVPLIPVWRATLLGTYHASNELSYSLGYRFSGRQHSGLLNTTTNQYPDPNPNTYGGRSSFNVFDAKVLYKFAKQWSASVGVDNITNEKYYTLYPYSQRTFFAGLKFDN
jgi:iron complex outermembrane receptor protein